MPRAPGHPATIQGEVITVSIKDYAAWRMVEVSTLIVSAGGWYALGMEATSKPHNGITF